MFFSNCASHISRDQYGFKMSSQWLSVEDHHEHDKLYQPIVDRRAQKWQQILAENDGKWPEPSSKCKKVDDVDL
jgi:hypothetical protein